MTAQEILENQIGKLFIQIAGLQAKILELEKKILELTPRDK